MNQQQPYTPIVGGQKPPVVRAWLWILLVVVILAGAGFVWYFYFGPGKSQPATTTTPTTDETADWKTYTNSTFNFSVKYPEDWVTQEWPNAAKTQLEVGFAPSQNLLRCNECDTPSTISLFINVSGTWSSENVATTSSADQTIGGLNTKLITGTVKPDVKQAGMKIMYDSFSKNSNNFEFVLADSGLQQSANQISKYSDTFKNMLKTFKFTSASTSTTSTADSATKEAVCKALFPSNIYSPTVGLANIKVKENFCAVDALSGNFARGIDGQKLDETGGGPGAHWLAVKTNDKWTKVQETQDMWDCAIIEKYSVPKTLFDDDECFNYATQTEGTIK